MEKIVFESLAWKIIEHRSEVVINEDGVVLNDAANLLIENLSLYSNSCYFKLKEAWIGVISSEVITFVREVIKQYDYINKFGGESTVLEQCETNIVKCVDSFVEHCKTLVSAGSLMDAVVFGRVRLSDDAMSKRVESINTELSPESFNNVFGLLMKYSSFGWEFYEKYASRYRVKVSRENHHAALDVKLDFMENVINNIDFNEDGIEMLDSTSFEQSAGMFIKHPGNGQSIKVSEEGLRNGARKLLQ